MTTAQQLQAVQTDLEFTLDVQDVANVARQGFPYILNLASGQTIMSALRNPVTVAAGQSLHAVCRASGAIIAIIPTIGQ